MAEFQETARIKIKELSSKNPATRRAAALYLGEAGVDEAITKLVTVYKNDPDKSVRKAAEYALGMFRAVDIALQRGQDEKVVALLRQIIEENKLGKRLATPVGTVVRLEALLAMIFVGLLVLHLVLPDLGPLPGGIQVPRLLGAAVTQSGANLAGPELYDAAIADARLAYQQVYNDALTLQAQFQRVLGGGDLDCSAFFNEPSPFELPASVAQVDVVLAGAITTLNEAQSRVAAAKTRYDEDCFGETAITTGEVGGLLAPMLEVQRLLPNVEAVLNAPRENPFLAQLETATPQVTEAPVLAPTEALQPTAPVSSAEPRVHLVPLYGIIDSVTDPRGANGLLRQYWRDASAAGASDACRDPVPQIPENYSAPLEDVLASPSLGQAIEQVNIGLDLVRQGWQLFHDSCVRRDLFTQSDTGLQIAETAEQAFRNADALLAKVRAGA